MITVNVTKEFIEAVKRKFISLHDECVRKSGGELGILSEGSLDFALYDILRFSTKHEDNPLLVAAYAYITIATKHCFIDGNKRASHLFAKGLLLEEGIRLKLRYNTACPFIIKVATGENTLEDIHEWLPQNTEKLKQDDKEKYLKEFLDDMAYAKEGAAKDE